MTRPQLNNSIEFTQRDHTLSPWQSTIIEGNNAFERGALLEARDKYRCAHALAVNLIHQFSKAKICQSVLFSIEHCCPAYVVAAHNLADTYMAMQHYEQACQWLCDAHLTLSKLLDHPNSSVKSVVAHHHRKTYLALVDFAKLHSHEQQLIEKINHTLRHSPSKTTTLH
jgi:hypothetical protein